MKIVLQFARSKLDTSTLNISISHVHGIYLAILYVYFEKAGHYMVDTVLYRVKNKDYR